MSLRVVSANHHEPSLPAPGARPPVVALEGRLVFDAADSLMSEFDATWIEYRVLDGRPADVHELAIHVDFLDAMRCGPVVRGLFALRAAAVRVAVTARRSLVVSPSEPGALRVGELPEHGDLVRLGEDLLSVKVVSERGRLPVTG